MVLDEYVIAHSPPKSTLKLCIKNNVKRVSCFCRLQKNTRINADDHPIRDALMDSLAAISAPSRSAYLPAAQSVANPLEGSAQAARISNSCARSRSPGDRHFCTHSHGNLRPKTMSGIKPVGLMRNSESLLCSGRTKFKAREESGRPNQTNLPVRRRG